MPFEQALAMVLDGTIRDSKTPGGPDEIRPAAKEKCPVIPRSSTTAPGSSRRRGPPSGRTRCCWPGSPCPNPGSGRWTCAADAALWRWSGTTRATAAPARRWSWTPDASALCAAAVRGKRRRPHHPPYAPTCGTSAGRGPRAGVVRFCRLQPALLCRPDPAAPHPVRAAARHTDSCTLADAVNAAARALREGGRFTLCHRPDQLAEVFCALRAARLEPKRLAFARQRPGSTPLAFCHRGPEGPPSRAAAGTRPAGGDRRRPLRKIIIKEKHHATVQYALRPPGSRRGPRHPPARRAPPAWWRCWAGI